MKFIKLSRVIPAGIIVALLFAFRILVLDRLIKNALISTCEGIFSAKVEVEKLRLKLLGLSMDIKNLKVGDKDNPMRNLFEIGRISFGMSFPALLEGKFVIERMIIENIRWHTPRKTSAALPPRRIKKIEKRRNVEERDPVVAKLLAAVKQKAKEEVSTLPIIKDVKTIKQEIKSIDIGKIVSEEIDNLKSKKAIDKIYADAVSSYEKYKSDIIGLNIDEKIKDTEGLIKRVSEVKVESLKDVPVATRLIPELLNKKQSLEEIMSKISSIKRSIDKDFIDGKEILSKIDELVKDDYRMLLAKVKLPEITRQNIARVIFGELWLRRAERALHYIHLARNFMPKRKKEQRKSVYPRLKGMDVTFHKEKVYPKFWLKKVKVSATTPSLLTIYGDVSDISSDQIVTGLPAKVEIGAVQADQTYKLLCIFDRRGDEAVDSIELKLIGLPVDEIDFTHVRYLPRLEKAFVDLVSQFKLIDGKFSCNMILDIKNIVLGKTTEEDFFSQIVFEVLRDIKMISLKANLYIDKEEFKSEIDSNIDELLILRLKGIYGKEVERLKADLKKRFESEIDSLKEEFLKKYSMKRDEVFRICLEKHSAVKEYMDIILTKYQELKDEVEKIRKTDIKEKLKIFK